MVTMYMEIHTHTENDRYTYAYTHTYKSVHCLLQSFLVLSKYIKIQVNCHDKLRNVYPFIYSFIQLIFIEYPLCASHSSK